MPRKLCWIEVDEEGKPEAVGLVRGAPSVALTAAIREALAALPEAVVDDSAAELARLRALLVAWDRDATDLMASYYAQYPDQDPPEFTSPTDRLMREAHRLSGISPDPLPFVILDRSRLIEEIAKVYSIECSDSCCESADVCDDCKRRARALLSRLQTETP